MDRKGCKDCGAWGKGVVRRNGLCLHCTRKQSQLKASWPSLVQVCLDRGFVDISPEGDGSFLKRVVRESSVPQQGKNDLNHPQVGCPTRFHFVSRTWDDADQDFKDIFETTRDVVDGKHAGGTDDPHEIILGRFNKDTIEDEERKQALDPNHVIFGRCRAWDAALLTMGRAEVAQFVCSPAWAYGQEGYPPKVLPNEYVLFEFEVLEWDASLPEMPSREDMERARQERELEEKKRMEENPPPTFEERLRACNLERGRGNELFQSGQFELAKKAYDAAFVNVFYSDDEYNFYLDSDQRSELDKCKLTLHLNRAMVKLKLNQVDEALWDCDKSLELDPSNLKGLYRRCITHCHRLERELNKEDQGQFWVVEKAWDILKLARGDLKDLMHLQENKGDSSVVAAHKRVKELEARLTQYTKRYREQEKNLFKTKIWDKVEKENESNKQLEKEKELEQKRRKEEEELADMPDLEE